jgi:hypothetical protein
MTLHYMLRALLLCPRQGEIVVGTGKFNQERGLFVPLTVKHLRDENMQESLEHTNLM